MEANIHTPERLDGETFTAYQARRIESRRVAGLVRYVALSHNRNRQEARRGKRQIGARQYRIARKNIARVSRASA